MRPKVVFGLESRVCRTAPAAPRSGLLAMAEDPTTPPPKHRDLDALEKIANSKIDPLGDVVGKVELYLAVTGEPFHLDCQAKTTAGLRKSIAAQLNRPPASIVFLKGCNEICDNDDVDAEHGAVCIYVSNLFGDAVSTPVSCFGALQNPLGNETHLSVQDRRATTTAEKPGEWRWQVFRARRNSMRFVSKHVKVTERMSFQIILRPHSEHAFPARKTERFGACGGRALAAIKVCGAMGADLRVSIAIGDLSLTHLDVKESVLSHQNDLSFFQIGLEWNLFDAMGASNVFFLVARGESL